MSREEFHKRMVDLGATFVDGSFFFNNYEIRLCAGDKLYIDDGNIGDFVVGLNEQRERLNQLAELANMESALE